MHTASFCKYDYLKLVLSAPPRLVDAFGTRVWRRAGSSSLLDRFAKLNRVARCFPGGVVRRRCPSEQEPFLILRRYTAFRAQFVRARAGGSPNKKQP